MNIIRNRKIFLTFSGLLVILSVVAIIVFGFRQGIEFTGGTLSQLTFPTDAVTREHLIDVLKSKLQLRDAIVTPDASGKNFSIKSQEITEADHQKYLEAIKKEFPSVEELSFETIGAAIGKELRSKALTAFILVIVAISLYIAFAFRKVSYPVSSWKYGFITLITLFHDAIIPAGLFAVLGRVLGVEIDINFLVAILMVMGFSVHDTIVVFDRIRENLKVESGKKLEFDGLVNSSINQTFARSVNTSLTLILVLLALLLFGALDLHYFVLAILVGVIFGTYSSIFVASPLLTLWRKKTS